VRGGENATAVDIKNDESLCAIETDVGTPSHHMSCRQLCCNCRCRLTASGESDDVEHAREPGTPPREALDQQRSPLRTEYAHNICAGCVSLAGKKPTRIAFYS